MIKDCYVGALVVTNVLLWFRLEKTFTCGVRKYMRTVYFPFNFVVNLTLL